MANLNITERQNASITILDLEGAIRLGDGFAELHSALRQLAERGENKVLLNMAKVSYVDSSGLGELVSGYTMFRRNRGEMKLLHLSAKVHELMLMTKLVTVFDIYDDETEAVESFAGTSAKSAYANSLL